MNCPKCGAVMGVLNSRRVSTNPQVVRRRRRCAACGTSFQTEERPRLRVRRAGKLEPFLRGELLASLRRAAADCDPPVPDDLLSEAVRRVVVGMLADGTEEPSTDEVRQRAGEVLLELDLERVAARYDPLLNPYAVRVTKRGKRPDEVFVREKLKSSILAAAAGFLQGAEAELLVDEIEMALGARSTSATTDEIRAMVEDGLRRHDERTFLRYTLGGHMTDETLQGLFERISQAARVVKRDGSVVLFEGVKLAKSIRRSFVAERRDAQEAAIMRFVAAEEQRVRERMRATGQPETTACVGQRVLQWLFDIDELAWANYWLAFASDHELTRGASPIQQLARARQEMLRQRAPGASTDAATA